MSDSKEVVNIKVDVQGLTEAEKDAKAIEGALKKIDTTLKKAEKSGKNIASAMKKLDAEVKKVESSANGIESSLKKIEGSLKQSAGIALTLSQNLASSNKQVLMMVGNVGRLVVALTAAASQAGLISRSLAGGAIPPIIPGGGGRRGGAIVPVGGGGGRRGGPIVPVGGMGGGRAMRRAAPPSVINLPGRPQRLALPPYAGRDTFRVERRMQRMQATQMKREARRVQLLERFKAREVVRPTPSRGVLPFPSNRARPHGGGSIPGGGQLYKFRSRKQIARDADKIPVDPNIDDWDYDSRASRLSRAHEYLESRKRRNNVRRFPSERIKPSGPSRFTGNVRYPFRGIRHVTPDQYDDIGYRFQQDIWDSLEYGKFSPREVIRKQRRLNQRKSILAHRNAEWERNYDASLKNKLISFPYNRARARRGPSSGATGGLIDLYKAKRHRIPQHAKMFSHSALASVSQRAQSELFRDDFARLQDFDYEWNKLGKQNILDRPTGVARYGGVSRFQGGPPRGTSASVTGLQRDPLVPYGGIVPHRRRGFGRGRVIDAQWEDVTPQGYIGGQGQRRLNPAATNWWGRDEGNIHGPIRRRRPASSPRANLARGLFIKKMRGTGGATPSSMTLGPPGIVQGLKSKFLGGREKRALAAESGGGGGIGRGAAGFDKIAKKSSLAEKNIHRADKAMAKFHRSLSLFLRTVATAGVLGFGAYYAAQAADSYTVLQNKLRTVTTSEEQLNTVTERVIDLALETRAPVQEVATAFRRFDLAVQDSGGTQEESLKITEAVTKGMKAAGATAAETSQGLIQLSQAFNKGKLDGDELRSVSENMPPVFYGLAKSLGVTRGALYDMGRTGALTGDLLRKSILENLPAIREEFKKLKVPIGDAFLNIRTATLRLFGQWDKFHGYTSDISGFFLDMSKDAGLLATAIAGVGTAFASILTAGAVHGVFGLLSRFAAAPLASTLTAVSLTLSGSIPWIIRYWDNIKLLEKGLYLSAEASAEQKKEFRKLADETNILDSTTDSYVDEQERLNKVLKKTPNEEFLSFLATMKNLLVDITAEVEYQLQYWKVFAKVLGGVLVGLAAAKFMPGSKSKALTVAAGTLAGVSAAYFSHEHDDSLRSREFFRQKATRRAEGIAKTFTSPETKGGALRGKGKKRGKDVKSIGKMAENFHKNFKLLAAMEDKVDAQFGLRIAEQLEGSAKTLEFRKQNIHYLDKEQEIIDGWISKFGKIVDEQERIEEIAKSRLGIDEKIDKANINLLSGLRTEKQRHQDIKSILSEINEFELQGVSYSKAKVGVLKEEERILGGRLDRAKVVQAAQGQGPRSAIAGLQAEGGMLGTALARDEVSDSEKVGVGERLQAINEEIKEKNNQILLESESFLDQFGVRVEEVWMGIGDRISSTFTDIFGQLITYGSKTETILKTLQSALQSLAKEFAGAFLKSAVGSLTKTIFKQEEAVEKQKTFNIQIKAAPSAIQKMSAAEVGSMVKKTAATKTLGKASTAAAVSTAAVDWSAIPRALAMMAILGLASYGIGKFTSGMGGDDGEAEKLQKEAEQKSKDAVKDAKIASLERKLESRRLASGSSPARGLSEKIKTQHDTMLKETQALQTSAGVLASSGVNFSTDITSSSGYSATISPGSGIPSLPGQLGMPLLGNSAPQVNVVNVVVGSEEELDSYLNSDMGQDTIVNIIKRNASDIRDEIA